MNYQAMLEIGANIASIVTALIAGGAYGLYRWDRYQKQVRLEKHLKQTPETRGPRPVTYLAAELGMTEAEIVNAAFRSKHITREVSQAMIGAPSIMLLRYQERA